MQGLVRHHPRLFASVGVGLAVFFFLPGEWARLTRVLVCWNAGVGLFLILVITWMHGLSAAQICSKYIEEDESGPYILVVVTAAALLSMVAIVDQLATMKQVAGTERVAHFTLAVVTLLNSWTLVPIMFATHYADMFYSVSSGNRPLRFPKTTMPVFWDFAYFSFTISAACQTADVSTLNTRVRKVALVHTVIAFLFNASILGFAINVTAGLIGAN